MIKISPTQIKLWNSCQRAWGYRYIEGKKTPPTASQDLGTRVHEILERWLRFSEVPDPDEVFQGKYPGRIARAGIPLLPHPSDITGVEEEFTLEVFPGVALFGFIDFLAHLLLGDHKTTTNFKWALTEEQLAQDVQAIIYAKYLFYLYDSSDTLELRWVYYRTTGNPEAKKVSARVSRKEVEEKVNADILPVVKQIAQATTLEDLDINPKHCSAYGGCPHQEYCRVTAKERFRAAMDIKGWIASQQKQIADAPPVPEAPPPVPAVPVIEEDFLPEVPAAPTTTGPDYDPEDLNTWTRDQLKAKAMDMGLVDSSSRFGSKKLMDLIEEASAAPPVPEAFAVGQALGEEAKKAPVGDTFLPEETCTTACMNLEVSPTASCPLGTLYVDCLPAKGGKEKTMDLSSLIAGALASLDTDYRLMEDNDFGKAAGFLSSVVKQEILSQWTGFDLDIICSSRTPEHLHCLAMLEGLAQRVIRGTR
jgi:hypothetical protein